MTRLKKHVPADKITNFAPYLPNFLTVDRKPMSMTDYFTFVPVFSTYLPPVIVLRAGRQVGKTQSVSGRLIMQLATVPGHKILVVLPLQEQSDRMSSIIFKPMVDDSLVQAILGYEGTMGSVRRRRFANGSMIHFSYAWLDTERVRQLSADWLYIDEAQDMDPTFVPVIKECQSARPEPIMFVSGTSKTKSTYLENSWKLSSQGIWHVPCHACGFVNVCCVEPEGHLMSMIGPARDDICEATPGTLCHRCRRPVNPRPSASGGTDGGHWVHRHPERTRDQVGYYVPQPIMPIHNTIPSKWATLVGKMNGGDGYTTARFYNEVLGEAYDDAFLLVSEDDLIKAAKGIGPNSEALAMARASKYLMVVLGVDWGGDGMEGNSRTKVAAVGILHDGTAEVFFGAQFQPSTDAMFEGREVLRLANLVRAKLIAHDYNGAATRESVMNNLGWPARQIVPMVYRQVIGGEMVEYIQPQKARTRGYHVLDKGRAIEFVCMAIRAGRVKFFDWDFQDPARPGLIHDFTTVTADRIDTPSGRAFRVRKIHESDSDDFVHATTFAAIAGWELTRAWPNLTSAGRVRP